MKKLYFIFILPFILFTFLKPANATNKTSDDPKSEFTAKVNGKNFKAGIRMCNIEISGVEFMGMTDDDYFAISFTLDGPPKEGVFEINNTSKNKATYGKAGSKYTLGKNDIGKVVITKYDAAKKLFSGTFELKLTNEKTGEKVNITDGKFTNMAFYDKAPKNSNAFKTNLNGSNWNFLASIYAGNKDSANLMATDEKKVLMFSLPQNIAPGAYDISAKSPFKIAVVSIDFKDTFDIKKGTLTILNNDVKAGTVSGQFELEAKVPGEKKNMKFTDGSFSIFYKEQ